MIKKPKKKIIDSNAYKNGAIGSKQKGTTSGSIVLRGIAKSDTMCDPNCHRIHWAPNH
jgi:hypothetical protein